MPAPFRAHWFLITVALCGRVDAQEPRAVPASEFAAKRATDDRQSKVLTADEWRRLDVAIDRALDWLVAQQQPDGSFPTLERGQPGVTGLCVLAFMAHGHVPGDGPYGEQLAKATRYIMSCQKENGLVTLNGPGRANVRPAGLLAKQERCTTPGFARNGRDLDDIPLVAGF